MFIKYPSIENTYREQHIQRFVDVYPELLNEKYIILCKVHGANISFISNRTGQFKIAKRTSLADTGFYGIYDVLPKYQDLIDYIVNYSIKNMAQVNLFGEFFGSNIQKGVDYGQEKRFTFYDLMIDGELRPHCEFVEFMKDFPEYIIKSFDIVNSLQEALDFNIEVPSLYNPVEGNIIEGVVIKPLLKNYMLGEDYFVLKKKNEKFRERVRAHAARVVVERANDVIKYREIFGEYINEERVLTIFSKYGKIEKTKQIGNYIQYVLNDAKEDFIKDYPEVLEVDKKEMKFIFNYGSDIMKLLQPYV